MDFKIVLPERHVETIMAMGCADRQCVFNAPAIGPNLGCMCLNKLDDYEGEAILAVMRQIFKQAKERGYETD